MTCQKEINPSVAKKIKLFVDSNLLYPNSRDVFFPNQPIIFEAWAPCKKLHTDRKCEKTRQEGIRGKSKQQKKKNTGPAGSSVALSIHCSASIKRSVFSRSLSWGVNHCSVLRTKITQDRLSVRSSDPPRRSQTPGSMSGPCSLNHHHQESRYCARVNYPGRRTRAATWSWGFPYPAHQSLWQPNHRQLIGFGGEGDLNINNSLRPRLHLISLGATGREATLMRTAGEKNAMPEWKWASLSLNHLILLFVSPFFCSPLHLFFPILAVPVLFLFAVTHPQSPHTHSLRAENKKQTALTILSDFHVKKIYANLKR